MYPGLFRNRPDGPWDVNYTLSLAPRPCLVAHTTASTLRQVRTSSSRRKVVRPTVDAPYPPATFGNGYLEALLKPLFIGEPPSRTRPL